MRNKVQLNMRRPAKLLATILALLAGGAAAAPGNHGGLHEWLGICANRDDGFVELAGESIGRWEFLIRGATVGGTTAGTAVARRAVSAAARAPCLPSRERMECTAGAHSPPPRIRKYGHIYLL